MLLKMLYVYKASCNDLSWELLNVFHLNTLCVCLWVCACVYVGVARLPVPYVLAHQNIVSTPAAHAWPVRVAVLIWCATLFPVLFYKCPEWCGTSCSDTCTMHTCWCVLLVRESIRHYTHHHSFTFSQMCVLCVCVVCVLCVCVCVCVCVCACVCVKCCLCHTEWTIDIIVCHFIYPLLPIQ